MAHGGRAASGVADVPIEGGSRPAPTSAAPSSTRRDGRRILAVKPQTPADAPVRMGRSIRRSKGFANDDYGFVVAETGVRAEADLELWAAL